MIESPYYGPVGDPFSGAYKSHLAVRLLGHQDHALGLDPADHPGFKVGEDADLLPEHVLRGVIFGYSGNNDAFVDTGVDGELEKLVGLRNPLSLKDCGGADVHGSEVLEGDLGLLRLDLVGGFLGLGGLCGGLVGFLGGVQFGDLGVDDAVLDLAEQQDRLSELMSDRQDIPTAQVVPSQYGMRQGD